MSATDRRLSQIEDQLRELSAKLGGASAEPPAAPKTPPSRFWRFMGDEGPKLIGALVLLAITYWIKDSVDLAIKQQQLQLDVTKEMKGYLETMAESGSDNAQIERAAVLVADYGPRSIVPLLNEVRHGGLRATAAESGLSFVALGDTEAVCQILLRALSNETQQFGWEAHLRVIRLVGGSGCPGAKKVLRGYQDAVNEAQQNPANPRYFTYIADQPGPDQLDQLQAALKRALEQVARR
jgi:hypothetical protein